MALVEIGEVELELELNSIELHLLGVQPDERGERPACRSAERQATEREQAALWPDL